MYNSNLKQKQKQNQKSQQLKHLLKRKEKKKNKPNKNYQIKHAKTRSILSRVKIINCFKKSKL